MSFISLAPSVGNIQQVIVSLSTKLLKIDGISYNSTPVNVQELMKQNEELKRRAHPEGSNTSLQRHNRSKHDKEVSRPENSKGRDAFEYTEQSMHGNDHMMKSLRRELDEVNNAMKGKTTMNLDGMLKRTDSPFIVSVLECPLPLKFHLSQLEFYDGTKDPLDHIRAFRQF